MAEVLSVAELKDLAGKTFQSVYKVLDNYNQMMDQLIPWDSMKKFVSDVDKYIEHYSNAVSGLVGQVKTLMLNAMDQYFKSTQTIYEWCALAVELLNLYKEIVADKSLADDEKTIILAVLEEGEKMMEKAQADLHECKKTFNDASGKITTVKIQLKNDFDQNSTYFGSVIANIRWGGYAATGVTAIVGGVVAFCLLGPFGLLVPLGILGIGAAAIEGVAIPLVKKKFEEVERRYQSFHAELDGADQDIKNTRDKLDEEIKVIGALKGKAKFGRRVIGMRMISSSKKTADELIALCLDYQRRHGKKN